MHGVSVARVISFRVYVLPAPAIACLTPSCELEVLPLFAPAWLSFPDSILKAHSHQQLRLQSSLGAQELVQPMQQALVIGLQQPQLATAAVATLERWESTPSSDITPACLAQVTSSMVQCHESLRPFEASY